MTPRRKVAGLHHNDKLLGAIGVVHLSIMKRRAVCRLPVVELRDSTRPSMPLSRKPNCATAPPNDTGSIIAHPHASVNTSAPF